MDIKDLEIVRLKNELEKAQHDVDDVLESTKDIEQQLEQDVTRAEKQLETTRQRNVALGYAIDDLKEKLAQSRLDHDKDIAKHQKEFEALKRTHEQVRSRLRDEEMKHDDLARQERIVTMSYKDLEDKYFEALERNAHLESELEEKFEIQIETQRLKDTIRDLTAELAIEQSRKELHERTKDISLVSSKALQDEKTVKQSPNIDDKIGDNIEKRQQQQQQRRPQSRLATSNSVQSLQNLTNTISLLREKMKIARETPLPELPLSDRRQSIPVYSDILLATPKTARDLANTLDHKHMDIVDIMQPFKSSSHVRRQSGIPAFVKSASPSNKGSPERLVSPELKSSSKLAETSFENNGSQHLPRSSPSPFKTANARRRNLFTPLPLSTNTKRLSTKLPSRDARFSPARPS